MQVWKIPGEVRWDSKIQLKLAEMIHWTFSDQNELYVENLDNSNKKTLSLEKYEF